MYLKLNSVLFLLGSINSIIYRAREHLGTAMVARARERGREREIKKKILQPSTLDSVPSRTWPVNGQNRTR